MDDIAIVGMSCLFPGASTLEAFWQNIVEKRCAIMEPPEDWGGHYSFDPDSKSNDSIYCRRGGYLGDLARFDPLKYGIMPAAVDGAEPEHFLALKVADEALRDAGYPEVPINKDRTEVILGRGTYVNRALMNLHQHGFVIPQTLGLIRELMPGVTDEQLVGLKKRLKEKLPPFDPVTAPGIVSSIMSGRIANRLDLKGANYTIDGACASSLLAVDYAVQDLRSGRCDAAIAGGVQLSANNLVLMVFSQLGALSRKPELRPFDADADGTMLGEGVGMVVLKRLDDAVRDGNRVYAVIKGVGTASDGRAKSVVAPRIEGEVLAIRRAYELAGLDPATVGLIEAHGTAIPLGDATEVQALSMVFGDGRGPASCALGTVKSMIGHLIPASGMAGLIKASLALYHRVLPPTLCGRPNPTLALEKTPFYLNTETRPWVHGSESPRRAGVNAFGFGGINAHAILEEHVDNERGAPVQLCHRRWETELVVLSSGSVSGLVAECELLAGFLERSQGAHELKDIAFTVNAAMKKGACRLSIVASSVEDLSGKLAYALGRLKDPACRRVKDKSGIFYFSEPLAAQGKVAFLFPGEGSQYVGMLKDLCLHFPEVRRSFDVVDRVFSEDGAGRPLSDSLFPPGAGADDGSVWRMEVAVQSVTTANRALSGLLHRLGIGAHAVAGHSSGEFGALEAAGAIRIDGEAALMRYVRDGIKSVRGVSAASETLDKVTLLAAGSGDRDKVRAIEEKTGGTVRIAMDNCPYQIIICVRDGAEELAKKELASSGVTFTTLPFHRAYHTPAFEAACAPLRAFFDSIEIARPTTRMYSCAYAAPFPETPEGIRKTAVDQWALPVRFRDTIEAMYADGFRVFIEVGPGSNLTAFVNDILRGRPYAAVPTNTRHMSGTASLHHALGLLLAHGVDMDLDYLYLRRAPVRLDLRAAAALRKQEPKLTLTLPMLSLDRDEATALFGRLPAASAVVGAQDQQAPVEASRSVLDEYFVNQELFLESQEDVISAFLASRSGGERSHGTSSGWGHVEGAGEHLPFIGQAEISPTGREAVVTRTLDLDEDLFIRHHVLGGRVSMTDDTLAGLAVMPLTMSMEMIAEAASVLFPGRKFVGIKDFRAYRWVVLEEGSIALRMHVKRLDGGQARVSMSEAAHADCGQKVLMIEGTVIFADGYGTPPAAARFSLSNARPSRFTPETMYKTGMFSGPSFQAIERVSVWGSDGATATIKAMPTGRLFRSTADPAFLLDPVILDAAGQVAAHWNAEGSSSGFNFFPYRFSELNVYGPNPVAPQTVECRLRIRQTSESTYSSDIDIVGPGDRVLMELKGWEDKSFPLPETFYGIRHGSPEIALAEAWGADAWGSEDTECRRVADFPADLLAGHGGIWLKVLAHQVLSRQERKRWKELDVAADKRRIEWLLGRAAAKDVVRSLLKRKAGVDLCPADIEIEAGPLGCPVVKGRWAGMTPLVSIAHSSNTAAAIASLRPGLSGVGIDIEPVRTPEPGFLQFIAAPEETALLAPMQGAPDQHPGLRLWCAKEAAAKAIGTGLGGRPRDLLTRRVEAGRGVIEFEVRDGIAALGEGLAGALVAARTFVKDGFVVAISEYQRRS